MTQVTIQTSHADMSSLVDELVDAVDEREIILSDAPHVAPGAGVTFRIQLADGSAALEGHGTCAGAVELEDRPGRFGLLVADLRFDAINEVKFERIVLASRTKGEGTNVVDLRQLRVPVPPRSRAIAPPPRRVDTPTLRHAPSAPPPLPHLRAPSDRPTPRSAPPRASASSAPPRARTSSVPPHTSPVRRVAGPPSTDRATPASSERPIAASPPPARPPSIAPEALDDPTQPRVRLPEARASEPPATAPVVHITQPAISTNGIGGSTRQLDLQRVELEVPVELAAKATELAPQLATAGSTPPVDDVLLAALRIGLAALEIQADAATWPTRRKRAVG